MFPKYGSFRRKTMAETTNFTPTDEELEEIKREIFKNQLYRTDAFGNSLSEIEKIQQYIIDHKSELIAKRQEKRNAQNQEDSNSPMSPQEEIEKLEREKEVYLQSVYV